MVVFTLLWAAFCSDMVTYSWLLNGLCRMSLSFSRLRTEEADVTLISLVISGLGPLAQLYSPEGLNYLLSHNFCILS